MKTAAWLVLVGLSGSWLWAQPAALSPAVREFVTIADPVIVLAHVRVIDGTGAPPAEDQSILLEQGKIMRLGPASAMAVPAGARVLELKDHTVMPGLVGMHNHMFYP